MPNIRSFKELKVWQRAMDAAVSVFEMTKRFPDTEKYSLTDQIHRHGQPPGTMDNPQMSLRVFLPLRVSVSPRLRVFPNLRVCSK